MTVFFRPVYNFAGSFVNVIILGIHFMFAQVLYLYRSESSKTGMECHLGKTDAFYFQTLDQFTAKVKTGSRSSYSALMLGVYGLITFFVFFIRFTLNIFWQGRFSQFF